MTHLLYTSIILMLSLGAYHITVSKSTLFKFRRSYLIQIPVFSLIIPMFKGIWIGAPSESAWSVINLPEIAIGQSPELTYSATPFSISGLILTVYLFVAAVLLVRFLIGLRQIYRIKQQSVFENGIFWTSNTGASFSFGSYIFVPSSLKNSESEPWVVAHEKAHVKQNHTADIIFLELFKILNWFNPAAWLLVREIAKVHEFLADQTVVQQTQDRENYSLQLLKAATGSNPILVNTFKSSLIKQRIMMMTTPSKKSMGKVAILLALPMVSALTLAMQPTQKPMTLLSPTVESLNPEDSVYTYNAIDVKPEFPGGESALLSFIGKNTQYPKEAKEAGIEGKVFLGFVIDKTGKVTNVEVLKSVHPLLDSEAIRVVKSMPDWKPGVQRGKKVKVRYQLPINFRLDKKVNDSKTNG